MIFKRLWRWFFRIQTFQPSMIRFWTHMNNYNSNKFMILKHYCYPNVERKNVSKFPPHCSVPPRYGKLSHSTNLLWSEVTIKVKISLFWHLYNGHSVPTFQIGSIQMLNLIDDFSSVIEMKCACSFFKMEYLTILFSYKKLLLNYYDTCSVITKVLAELLEYFQNV